MAKAVDIGSRRLISLAPTPWVRWLTGDEELEATALLSGEFQWVARTNDVLIKVQSQLHGSFLVANELQLRPDMHMALRLRAYAALAAERYRLPVYPVVVNVLEGPLPSTTSYHSEIMGVVAHQDFRMINLWEVDADFVFERNLISLLPFTPILKGGDDEGVVAKAVTRLRADEMIAELEPLLAFFASFVMSPDVVLRIMRWDMTVIRESPWYAEILKEGIEQGIELGQVELLIDQLTYHWGELPQDLVTRIRSLSSGQLRQLGRSVFDARELVDIVDQVTTLEAGETA
jgi:predicted transposase YdaD